MLNDVKNLLGKLVRGGVLPRGRVAGHRWFDEDELFGRLIEPADAVQAWRAGETDAAWNALVSHFARRSPPLGFVAPDRVPGLIAESQRRFPDWRERLLAKVREEQHQGLAVYDRFTQPLTSEFDWRAGVPNPMADRLYAVRPYRLGFVPRWALACHYDHSLIPALSGLLDGWVRTARESEGAPAFRSSHVVIYHFMALLLAWPFLAALEEPSGGALATLRRRALQGLFEGCRTLNAAAGSGAPNNHLLAERFGEWLIAALLPEFDLALDRRRAETVWLDELDRQFFEDGGSFEHSVHYQEHGCEMALAYLLICRRNGWAVAKRDYRRIERMLHFQLTLAGPQLSPQAIGDTTEDPLLPLGIGEGWQSGFLREVQRAHFAPQAPPTPADDPTCETAFWLLDGHLAAHQDERADEAPFEAFEESGFCVFADPTTQARLVFRTGPTPTQPGFGGHSHSDLLSLSMSIGGATVLAPPGTGSYRFKPHPDLPDSPNLRAHFAGAASRSGLSYLGEEPYGARKGDFRDRVLPCHVEANQASAGVAGLSWAEGSIAGDSSYAGYRRGIVHIWDSYWLVYDRLPVRSKAPPAGVGWQFAPAIDCRLGSDGSIEARTPGAPDAEFRMYPWRANDASLVTGSFSPFRGWVSPSYGRLEPAPNLRYAIPNARNGAAFLLMAGSLGEKVIEGDFAAGDRLGFRIVGAGEESIILIGRAPRLTEDQWNDITFHGRVLYLRRGSDGAVTLRALGLERLHAPSWRLGITADRPADFELIMTADAVRWPRGEPEGLSLESPA